MKLYELTEAYNQLLDMDIDPWELQEHLKNLEDAIEDKADNIAAVLTALQGDIDTIKKEKIRLDQRQKAIEDRRIFLKNYLQDAMESVDKKKFKTALHSFNIQKNPPTLFIIDEDKIPEEFFRIKREINRTELKEAVKDGKFTDAAELRQTEGLRIR